MAFDVEDGTGKATSTSYVSVEDAIAYLTDEGEKDFCAAIATEPLRQQALVRATRYCDRALAGRVNGYPINEEQALLFPRTDGSFSGVPSLLKHAVCYAASIEYAMPGTLSAKVERPGRIKREKVEGAVEIEYADGAGFSPYYPALSAALSQIVAAGKGGGIAVTARM